MGVGPYPSWVAFKELKRALFFLIVKSFVLTWRAYANYAEWLFSLRKRLRGDTFAIFGYSTDCADYAVDLAYTTLYMKHTNYADYADKINLHVTTRDCARLRPAGPRLREHSCSFMAIIAPSCSKKNTAQVKFPYHARIWEMRMLPFSNNLIQVPQVNSNPAR